MGSNSIKIHPADLDSAEFAALIEAHHVLMLEITPPESIHALPLEGLRDPAVTVWEMRDAGVLIGCGALKELDPSHGEIKSMHTLVSRRGEGLGQRMLTYVMDEALRRGYRQLSLETGPADGFLPARKLYEANGFDYCGPFSDYGDDPNSVFMTRALHSV